MCDWGNHKEVEVTTPYYLSHTGQDRVEVVKVDGCIAGIVDALNRAGIRTDSCCCGHNLEDGYIYLSDGRKLSIARWK
jgi:hypothetical protein